MNLDIAVLRSALQNEIDVYDIVDIEDLNKTVKEKTMAICSQWGVDAEDTWNKMGETITTEYNGHFVTCYS